MGYTRDGLVGQVTVCLPQGHVRVQGLGKKVKQENKYRILEILVNQWEISLKTIKGKAMIIQGGKQNEHGDHRKSEWRIKQKQRCREYYLTNSNLHEAA